MLQLLGLSGRIGRGRWWLVQCICGVVVLVTNVPVLMEMFASIEQALQKQFAPDEARVFIEAVSDEAIYNWLPLVLLGTVVSYWLFVTSTVQRLHDRGNSGWRVLFAFVPEVFGLYDMLLSDLVNPSTLDTVMAVLAWGSGLVVLIWCVVECGMLRGEETANAYGSSPDAVRNREAMLAQLDDGASDGNGSTPPKLFAPPAGEAVFGRR